MRCSRLCLSVLARLLDLLINPPNEPDSVGDRDVVALPVAQPHVVHEEEAVLKKDLFIARSQAKRMRLPTGCAPPNSLSMKDSPCMTSCRYRVHSGRSPGGEKESHVQVDS